MSALLPTTRVADLDETEGTARWLVRSLWSEQAVGFIGGAPKCCKSWLGLDLAVSVATATPCLGHFEVEQPGPALVYLAEDSLPQVRLRIAGLCQHRRLNLKDLDLHVVTAPSLRLDSPEDQARLDATLAALRPRLLLLDPLVRMHCIDENSSAEVSALLGLLRRLQRTHGVAIAVVHHMSKRRSAQLGQALRGSTDLHAWSDSAAYLVRDRTKLVLTLEHRSAPAPDPFHIHLVSGDGLDAHLELERDPGRDAGQHAALAAPLTEHVRALLLDAAGPMSRAAIRKALRCNNQRLGDALLELEHQRTIERTERGWSARPRRDQITLA